MFKNPFKRDDHREAFDLAVKLTQEGLDRFQVSKQLDHNIPREMRLKIASKVARILYYMKDKS